MSLPRGRSLLRYEDESPEEIQLRFKKQQELQQTLLRQIEENKLKREQQEQAKKEQEIRENQRIERERQELEQRRQWSHTRRLEKTFDNQVQVNQFEPAQVGTRRK